MVIDMFGDHYEDLRRRREFILNVIRQEEDRFQRTLDVGLSLLDEIMEGLRERGETVIPGADAFRLYDTFGFPLDLTRDVAAEHGFTVDEAWLPASSGRAARPRPGRPAVRRHRRRGPGAVRAPAEELKAQGRLGPDGVEYLPREMVELETTVLAILRDGEAGQPGPRGRRSRGRAGGHALLRGERRPGVGYRPAGPLRRRRGRAALGDRGRATCGSRCRA